MGASIGCYIVHFTNPVFTFYFLVNFRSLSYPGTCLHGLIQILSKGEFPYLNITPFVLFLYILQVVYMWLLVKYVFTRVLVFL